jgi:hypothetical protein
MPDLGRLLNGAFGANGGKAQIFERGATYAAADGSEVAAHFDFPLIGIPNIATGDAGAAKVHAFTFQAEPPYLAPFVEALRSMFSEELALLPTGGNGSPIPMALGTPVEDGDGYAIDVTASVSDRQLYDIAAKNEAGAWEVIAPHAIYYKTSWTDCGIAHVTDIHVARRIDSFADRLDNAGLHDYANDFVNFNDHFRGFIRYANYLHDQGVLDVILATGDITDFQYENEDDIATGGNAWLVREILLGHSATTRFPDVEELRVPIFVVPGNHDYRKWAYFLIAILDLGITEYNIPNFSPYRLNWPAAIVAQGGDRGGDTPRRESGDMNKSAEIDRDMPGYKTYLADKLNYVVELGPHRVAMLDSGPDVGIPDWVDALQKAVGLPLPDDSSAFIGGSPNSEGVSQEVLELVTNALNETPDEGLFIVGLHAPLLNPDGEEYPYFLRETQRPPQAGQVYGWLGRRESFPVTLPSQTAVPVERIRELHPLWFGESGNSDDVTYVKREGPDDLLDWGVSRSGLLAGPQNVELEVHKVDDSSVPYALMKALAGIGARRKADVVLHGHVHRYAEFRLGPTGNDVATSMDFYTRNVHHYYPTRFTTGWVVKPVGINKLQLVPQTDVTYVDVVAGSPIGNEPTPTVTETRYDQSVMVPPYAAPLSAATDPRAWWDEHKPLVLLTEALGPFKNIEANLSGFRVMTVRNNVIERADFVAIEPLRESGYRLDWEQARTATSRRFHFHLCRSKEFDSPAAAGAPCGLMPSSATENIYYRDSENQILELWRDTADNRGAGNLTAVASATRAAGDPSCYLDSSTGQVILPYRGDDGAVHTVYSIPGGTGHDALAGAAGAPNTDSEPFGFYNAATGNHHVLYRAGGDVLVIYWSGPNAAQFDNLTGGAGAVEAQGNPVGYMDATRGQHIVVYRAVDDHIRSIYWIEGGSGMDDLSGFTGAPPAAGDPTAIYIPSKDLHQIAYRGADAHIHLIEWAGEAAATWRDLTTETGAPAAATDPCMWSTAAGDWRYLAYIDNSGHVHMIQGEPGNTAAWGDLTLLAYAPPGTGRPCGFAGPTYQNVNYRGLDNQIHEIRWL